MVCWLADLSVRQARAEAWPCKTLFQIERLAMVEGQHLRIVRRAVRQPMWEIARETCTGSTTLARRRL
eukprot:scaffold295195_cov32-Tisochrysis_lutea.AAC.2